MDVFEFIRSQFSMVAIILSLSLSLSLTLSPLLLFFQFFSRLLVMISIHFSLRSQRECEDFIGGDDVDAPSPLSLSFDRSLPSRHTYLGEVGERERERERGRTLRE